MSLHPGRALGRPAAERILLPRALRALLTGPVALFRLPVESLSTARVPMNGSKSFGATGAVDAAIFYISEESSFAFNVVIDENASDRIKDHLG